MLKEKILKRFWSKVNKDGSKILDTPCWEYTGYLSTQGYGRIQINKQEILTHRLSWDIHFGEIADDLFVLHKCDNPPCCNPDHLFLGDASDNMKDAWNKNRISIKRRDKSKVIELFNKYSSYSKVAQELGISRQRVHAIIQTLKNQGLMKTD